MQILYDKDEDYCLKEPCLSCEKSYVKDIWHDYCCDRERCIHKEEYLRATQNEGDVDMSDIGYLVRYSPYILEENAEGEYYHSHYEQIEEFFSDEIEFNTRVTELEHAYTRALNQSMYDGIDIDGIYWCELHRITSR